MTRYRTLFSTVLLASCLTGFAVPAIAAPYECWPKGDHGSFYEHRGERLERHHNKVLEALKLSPDQDGAWKKFVAAESPMVKNRNDPKSEAWAKLSSPERADMMLERMKDNQARMVERVAALKEFYAVLTPEQKVTFDELYAGSRRGIHRKHGHRTGMDKGAAK
ncbi:MAG: Spy/CpxP family protein refolding chaperone [Betaproteobacteria bacterium]|nr:Spy/CpxP family protein refolding chaperone [Betaproteobacteria bacterium]